VGLIFSGRDNLVGLDYYVDDLVGVRLGVIWSCILCLVVKFGVRMLLSRKLKQKTSRARKKCLKSSDEVER